MTSAGAPLLTVVGDLVEDVVAWRSGALEAGTDNPARIERVRGGSGANVAAAAAPLVAARFLGRVGADAVGDRLVASLQAEGVQTRVQRHGRTGTVVAIVDADGERTFVTDRAAAAELGPIDETWLDGTDWLHLPLYGFEAPASRAALLAAGGVVRGLGAPVSVDLSSVTAIRALGVGPVRELLDELQPAVVFANGREADEAQLRSLSDAHVEIVVKRGADPVEVHRDGAVVAVAVPPVDEVRDTTGAGDAFAAGYLACRLRGGASIAAVEAGCALAARTLRTAGAGTRRR